MIELILLAIFIYLIFRIPINFDHKSKQISSRNGTEVWVEHQLKKLLSKDGYIVFGDLIIPSVSKKIRSTQIDHVVISPYGIFCLETKAHRGNIYGAYKCNQWKQYLGNKSYDLYNPIKQNTHHVESLKYLLRSRLKSPIHSYVVFPEANTIKLSGAVVDLSLEHTIKRILNHKRLIYTAEDVEAMAKGLAYVSSRSGDFNVQHIQDVRKYVATLKR